VTRLSRWDIDWERVPWTLWTYIALAVGYLIIFLSRSLATRPEILAVIILVVCNYFLLRAVQWLWTATAALLALGLVIDLITQSGTWWGDATGVLQLGLLVLPPTRRFFGEPPAEPFS
jgi:hypothetical protein